MDEIRFRLKITARDFLAYYSGAASVVETTSLDGRTVRFPARNLRRFVTPEGVSGLFALVYDANNRFVEMKRLGN